MVRLKSLITAADFRIGETFRRLSGMRRRASWCSQPRGNVFSFSVGEFRFWLNATVGFVSENGDRYCTENRRSAAAFDLNSRYFNPQSDHIYDFAR